MYNKKTILNKSVFSSGVRLNRVDYNFLQQGEMNIYVIMDRLIFPL